MIEQSIARVRAQIAVACERAGRDPTTVTLVGVSKTFPAERVAAAHAAGLRHFGENRVQEGVAKIEALTLDGASWHLIGHLQTNKARPAARLFDTIESVDSLRVAEALSTEAVKLGRDIDVLIEVNYAGEHSKFGFAPDETLPAVDPIARLPRLRLRGLMTVAPFVDDAEQVRPVFRGMRALGERARDQARAGGDWHLSMGMSGDFAVAIEEGATIVRIGRAIFGERTPI